MLQRLGNVQAENNFLHCWKQLEKEARRACDKVVLLPGEDLPDLEKHDAWHFALSSAEKLRELIENPLQGSASSSQGSASSSQGSASSSQGSA